MIQCKLSELLGREKISQVEFAEQTGLSRQTVQKLYNNQISRIELTTIEKICNSLGIDVGELLVREELKLAQKLGSTRSVDIVLGARGVSRLKDAPLDSSTFTHGVGMSDIDALSHITRSLTELSQEKPDIGIRYFYDTLTQKDIARAEELLHLNQDFLFILGGGIVNGFGEYCVGKILEVGYDPRGYKPREPQHMRAPYKIRKLVREDKAEGHLTDRVKDKPQGIWDVKNEEFLLEIPVRKQFEEYQRGDRIIDAAIVYIDKPNRHHPRSIIIGIAGFGGKGNSLVTKHLFEQENLVHLDKAFKKIDDGTPCPIFLVVKVEFIKGDDYEDNLEENIEFIAESSAIS